MTEPFQTLNWGVQLREEKIARLEHQDGNVTGIVFTNNEVLPHRGIFVHPSRISIAL